MARRPSVYVRELTPEEGQQLRRLSRRSKVFATRQRAQILLASDSHMAARQIADVLRTDENQVRRVIHEFNADGMASLHPPTGGGRPRRIDEPTRMRIRDVALARPGDLGEPGTRWSLSRLRRYLIRRRVVASISVEHLRRILRAHNVTAQRTRTWKTSTDPFYEPKRAWVLAAYQAAEAGTLDGVVVSFDECGPISLRPWPGRCWARQRRTERMRATYTRTQGTRKFLAAYDVGADHLWGRLEARRVTGPVVLEFLRAIRARYPADVTVYIVMDNLSAHWVPDIRRWAADVTNNVALLPTPTNASHLNRVECHLSALVEFVINGSDYPDWTTFAKATHFYIRRRNHDHHDTRIRDFENRRKIA